MHAVRVGPKSYSAGIDKSRSVLATRSLTALCAASYSRPSHQTHHAQCSAWSKLGGYAYQLYYDVKSPATPPGEVPGPLLGLGRAAFTMAAQKRDRRSSS
jgi:hypothetical protein